MDEKEKPGFTDHQPELQRAPEGAIGEKKLPPEEESEKLVHLIIEKGMQRLQRLGEDFPGTLDDSQTYAAKVVEMGKRELVREAMQTEGQVIPGSIVAHAQTVVDKWHKAEILKRQAQPAQRAFDEVRERVEHGNWQ